MISVVVENECCKKAINFATGKLYFVVSRFPNDKSQVKSTIFIGQIVNTDN